MNRKISLGAAVAFVLIAAAVGGLCHHVSLPGYL